MRPGQTAPEFPPSAAARRLPRSRFNEAGADCPGILLKASGDLPEYVVASMRPGQTAPEFSGDGDRLKSRLWSLQ